jgi:tRNA-dihydrouridine synthase A
MEDIKYNKKNHIVCIAPMMEWTDRHYRYLARLMTRHTRLYTEMITSAALIHGDRARFLQFDMSEKPVALQLGGSDPKEMALAAKFGETAGYNEININVGCPSDRVQAGKFGVCLMREASLVARCVQAMRETVNIPVTVKCRIGVDHDDSYEFLRNFIDTVHNEGCNTFIIHARKAWLTGLNPKQNREIPELDYERVYQIKKDYPQLNVVINGGIQTLAEMQHHLNHVDGVMIGRQAYKHPQSLLTLDQFIFNDPTNEALNIEQVIIDYAKYIEKNMQQGVPFNSMSKHVLNLFQSVPGAKQWRRYLSENMHKSDAGIHTLFAALEKIHLKVS